MKLHPILHLGACLIAAVTMLPAARAATANLTNLRCEYRVDPFGIDAQKPRLSWVIGDPKSEISNLNSEISSP